MNGNYCSGLERRQPFGGSKDFVFHDEGSIICQTIIQLELRTWASLTLMMQHSGLQIPESSTRELPGKNRTNFYCATQIGLHLLSSLVVQIWRSTQFLLLLIKTRHSSKCAFKVSDALKSRFWNQKMKTGTTAPSILNFQKSCGNSRGIADSPESPIN